MLTRSKTNENTLFYSIPYNRKLLSNLFKPETDDDKYTESNDVWMTASSIYFYMINDPINDWFVEIYNKRDPGLFTSMLFEQGIKFENFVLNNLSEKYSLIIPSVSTRITERTVDRTLEYMERGYPIIHSAPVMNKYNKTKGIVDFLIRSDKFNDFFEEKYIKDNEKYTPDGRWYYIVVDVKYTTLRLKSDGLHLQNTPSLKYAKGQVYVYNCALGHLQDYTPSRGFILGRRFKKKDGGITHTGEKYYEKLGVVDFKKSDEWIIDEVNSALEWKRKCKKMAHEWECYPKPSVKELFPNICNKNSYFDKEKKLIAEHLGDITQVWNCSTKHREILEKNGITSFFDSRCTAELLNFKGENARILNQILDTQRGDDKIILPGYSPDIRFVEHSKRELFVDFETIPEILTDELLSDTCNRYPYIFLIGVGYIENKKWNYKRFLMKELSLKEENRIMREFIEFVGNNSVVYHWYNAEPVFWNLALKRHTNFPDHNLHKIDLEELFRKIPITIKGCLTFSLKDVAKSMYKYGFINTNWTNDIDNGLDCAAKAVLNYKNHRNDFDNIIKYNEIDCKVMYEILIYLRIHHSKHK
jgi:hypothetical protein